MAATLDCALDLQGPHDPLLLEQLQLENLRQLACILQERNQRRRAVLQVTVPSFWREAAQALAPDMPGEGQPLPLSGRVSVTVTHLLNVSILSPVKWG